MYKTVVVRPPVRSPYEYVRPVEEEVLKPTGSVCIQLGWGLPIVNHLKNKQVPFEDECILVTSPATSRVGLTVWLTFT